MKIKRLKQPLIIKNDNILQHELYFYYFHNIKKEKGEKNEKTNKKLYK